MATNNQQQSPYVGPRPFERRHIDIFYGRDKETSELLSFVSTHQLVLFYAQSGIGKTSLLNAGLIPLLEQEEFEIFPVARVRGLIPEHIPYERVTNPYVLNTLISWVPQDTAPAMLLDMSLNDFLRERPHLQDLTGFELPRVAIFDQFEELFSFYPDKWKQREDFFRQLSEAVAQDDLFRVIFVMREDFIAQIDPYTPLLPDRLRSRFRLEPMSPHAALPAVIQPLKNTQRSFAPGVAEQLVQELTKVRVEIQEGKTQTIEGESVEPVQLQVVCQNLWQHLPPDVKVINHQHLEAFGDVDEALSEFYEASLALAVAETGVTEKQLRDWFQQVLITPAGTRGTVYQDANETGGIPNSAVRVLENQHIVRAEMRAGGRWYELNHDRFVEPILNSNSAWGIRRNEAEYKAREGKIRQRLQRLLVIGGVAAFILLSGLTVFSLQQKSIAESNAGTATVAQGEAIIQANNAATEAANATIAQGEALIQADNAGTQAANAQNSAGTATVAQGEAIAQANIAATQAANAENNAGTATVAQGEALAQADIAATQAANAQNSAATATIAQGEAIIQAHIAGTQAALAEISAATATIAQGEAINSAATSDANAAVAFAAQQTSVYHEQEAASNAEQQRGLSIAAFSLVALEQNDPELALALAWEAYQIIPDAPEVRTALNRVAYSASALLKGIIQNDSTVVEAVFSNEDKSVFYAAGDGQVVHWNMATNTLIREFTTDFSNVRYMALADDSKLLAVVGASGAIVWDVETGNQLFQSAEEDGTFVSAAFSPTDTLAAFGNERGEILLWDYSTHDIIGILDEHSGAVTDLEFAPDGRRLASSACLCGTNRQSEMFLWDVNDQRLEIEMPQFDAPFIQIHGLAFHPSGRYILTADNDNAAIFIWEIIESSRSRDELVFLNLTSSLVDVTDMAFSPDGEKIYISYATPGITIGTFEPIAYPDIAVRFVDTLDGHRAGVNAIDVSSDGRRVLSASNDNSIRLWSSSDDAATLSIQIDCGCPINSMDLSDDEQTVIIGTHGNDLQVWDLETETMTDRLVRPAQVMFVNYSPEQTSAVTVAENGQVVVWRTENNREFELPETDITTLAPSMVVFIDETNLLVGYHDGTLLRWDIEEGTSSTQFIGHSAQIYGMQVNNDYSMLLSASGDGTARLWDIATGQQIHELLAYGGAVNAAAFSPDGSQVLTAHEFGFINLWDVASGRVVQTFANYSTTIAALAFHPSQPFILSGSSDGRIRLWDIETGEFIRSFEGHISTVTDIEFFGDGNTMVSSSLDRSVRLWQIDLSNQEIVSWVENNLYIRDLTCAERERFSVTPYCSIED